MTNTEKQAITEEMNVHQQWYTDARNVTLDTLPDFVRHVMNDYQHDYGTVCHAIAASAVAASWAAEKQPQGGITGFQASAIMWEYIKGWMLKEGPMRLQSYEDALYPQYAYRFNSIDRDTLDWLQAEAKKKLEEPGAHPDVVKHWEALAAGGVPFGLKVSDRA